jgi:CRISPR-associated protein Cas2
MMTALVCYDVNTEDKAGRSRLHKVAQTCKNYGQRVQLSVFECVLDDAQYEAICHKLKKIIKPNEDSLRIYKLQGSRDNYLQTFGLDHHTDFEDALIM